VSQSVSYWSSQLLSQSVSSWATQSVSQSVSYYAIQSVSEPVSQLLGQSVTEPVSQLLGQSISEPVSQLLVQSVTQSASQLPRLSERQLVVGLCQRVTHPVRRTASAVKTFKKPFSYTLRQHSSLPAISLLPLWFLLLQSISPLPPGALSIYMGRLQEKPQLSSTIFSSSLSERSHWCSQPPL